MKMAVIPAAGVMIANIPSPANGEIEQWLLSFAAIILIVERTFALIGRFKTDPRVIKLAEEFPTRQETAREVARLDSRIDECQAGHMSEDEKLHNDMKELQKEGSYRAASVHRRLDAMDQKLSAVDERSQSTKETLTLMNQHLMQFLREERNKS